MLIIFTDGASLGNPGPMGIGAVIYRDGKEVRRICEHAGEGTNNIAEYTAMIRSIEIAREIDDEIVIKSDSELIVKQMSGEYKVRNKNRCNLCGRARAYMRRFGLCRLCFRELAHTGQLPGVKKASW